MIHKITSNYLNTSKKQSYYSIIIFNEIGNQCIMKKHKSSFKLIYILLLLLYPYCSSAQEFHLVDFITQNQKIKSDSSIAIMALDSLQWQLKEDSETSLNWYEGRCFISQDKHLKIYQFFGEGCGAYCNPMFRSIVVFKDTSTNHLMITELDRINFNIDSIMTLVKNEKYLILGHHGYRARGIESVWGESALLINVHKEIKTFWKFQSTTSNLVNLDDSKARLSFNNKTKTISYLYDWYDENDETYFTRNSGKWKFDGNSFIEIEKKIKKIEVKSH